MVFLVYELHCGGGGHKVDKYFASEIKKSAIKCSKDNWDDIIQVGDVRNLHFKDGYLYNDSTKWYVGKFDLVAFLCGGQTGVISRIIYIIICLCAIWCITLLFKDTQNAKSITDTKS